MWHNLTLLKKLVLLHILSAARAVIQTITGTAPLTLSNAIAHAIHSLTRYGLCTQSGTPTPDAPVDIMCNNGRVVAGNCISSIPDGQGTFITPSELTTNRVYKAFPTDLVVGRSYSVTVTGTNWLILVQQKKPDGTGSSNVSGWVTTYDFTPEEGYIYGVAMRRSQDTITPADFNGTLTLDTTDGKPWSIGTPEVLTISGINLCNPAYYQGDGWYVGSNGVANANANGTLVFPCKPNTTYSWWHTAGAGGCRAFELPTDTVTLGQEASWAVGNPAYNDAMTVRKYTTSANAKLLCVLFGRDVEAVGRTLAEQFSDFMLVEGDISTATAYEPYVQPQTVNDIPMLLSVGDTKDEVELVGGPKTVRIGVYVFTGEENLTESANTDADGNKVFQFSISGKAYGRNNFIVTPYAVKNNSSYTGLHAGECQGGGSSNAIYFDGGTATNATEFKAKAAAAYASGNPWIVVYVLAAPTTEQTTAQHLVTHAGTNVVEVSANVGPVELEVVFSQEA